MAIKDDIILKNTVTGQEIHILRYLKNKYKNELYQSSIIFKNRLKDFLLYVVERYISYVRYVVNHKKFIHKWKPLSIQYMAYKKKHKLSLKTWKATGRLLSNLKVFDKQHHIYSPYRNNIVVSVNKNNILYVGYLYTDKYRHKNRHNIAINKVAKMLEYGISYPLNHSIPARPLFRPCMDYIKKNINKLYSSYYIRTNKLNRLLYKWK